MALGMSLGDDMSSCCHANGVTEKSSNQVPLEAGVELLAKADVLPPSTSILGL